MNDVKIFCTAKAELDIEQMIPFQGKFKSLSKENYRRLKNILLEEGIAAAITIWKDKGKNFMLDGHQRREALVRMRAEGIKVPKIPVNFTVCKDAKEARRKVLALASTYGEVEASFLKDFSSSAGFNIDDLKDRFQFPDFDLNAFTRSLGASALNEGAEKQLVRKAVKHIVKKGDLWLLGKHRLLCGDSRESESYKTLLKNEKPAICLTDPPYGIGFKYLSHDDRDKEKNAELVESVFKNITVPKIWTPGLQNLSRDLGKFGETKVLVWFKKFSSMGNGLGGSSTWEPIFVVGNPTVKKLANDVLEILIAKEDFEGEKLVKAHPCPKPVQLIGQLIQAFTNTGNLVLDPFIGSGSTLIAAERLGRRAFGIEIEPAYCDLVIARWEQETKQKAKKA